jgi:hypothetical protein
MPKEVNHLNINNNPELVHLVEAVRNAHRPFVLEQDNEAVAVVRPIAKRTTRKAKARFLTEDDPLWKLVGTGESSEPTDIRQLKDTYLAEAYSNLHSNK